MRRQADFFCGKLNGITFPYSSGRIHFVAFFLKLLKKLGQNSPEINPQQRHIVRVKVISTSGGKAA